MDYVDTLQAKSEGPLIVHCSAGVGRTGIWCSIDICKRALQEYRFADAADTVRQMREDRGGMVQTYEQLQFVHNAITDYARQHNIIDWLQDDEDPILRASVDRARRCVLPWRQRA